MSILFSGRTVAEILALDRALLKSFLLLIVDSVQNAAGR